MQGFEFELATDSVAGCLAGQAGGAHRVELSRQLEVGGLTPDGGLVERAIAETGLPVHVLVRPHARGFCYDRTALQAMHLAIREARRLGAAGVVVGVLTEAHEVDVARTRELVESAAGMQVTFHRAFDESGGGLLEALEAVVATGCTRLLTSGRAADVTAGTDGLRQLVEGARGRLRVAAGGGLRIQQARALARQVTGADFHATLRYLHPHGDTVMAGEVSAVLAELRAGSADGG